MRELVVICALGGCAASNIGGDTPISEEEPYYIVSNAGSRSLRMFDLEGRFLGDLVPAGGFLPGSSQIGLSPDGSTVLVAAFGAPTVWQVDRLTGEDLGPLGGTGENGLIGPSTVMVSPDGRVLVADFQGGAVHAFDWEAGAWLGPFLDAGHLVNPHEIVSVDGGYLVTDYYQGSISRFSSDGRFEAVLNQGRTLRGPLGMLAHPDGETVLVANNHTHDVARYDQETGDFLGQLVEPGLLAYPEGMEITPEGELLVASAQNATVFRFDIDTAELLGQFEPAEGDDGVVDVLLVDPSRFP